MTAILQFSTKFGGAKLNNNNGKGIAETMMELSSTHFDGESFIVAESTNVVEASVHQTQDTVEMFVESQSR